MILSSLIYSFLDKLFVMSSNEALAHFMRNPRPYLAPHLPRPPCKVCVLGPPHSGKTTVAHALAQRYNAKVNRVLLIKCHLSSAVILCNFSFLFYVQLITLN